MASCEDTSRRVDGTSAALVDNAARVAITERAVNARVVVVTASRTASSRCRETDLAMVDGAVLALLVTLFFCLLLLLGFCFWLEMWIIDFLAYLMLEQGSVTCVSSSLCEKKINKY